MKHALCDSGPRLLGACVGAGNEIQKFVVDPDDIGESSGQANG